MSEDQQKWIIKDASGQVRGPFSTRQVLKLISKGEFAGDEQIGIELDA